ncbi:DgyrCDS4610 [Dimorphilus gyrociliatus]|uniref:DgyrCDS4610 n=1 Tax=Dimorphilus gyrociliatus TaxID=2664684 RepID=A0A7I8VI07_9ANNE|nr:DgyrCDS4610 [Dimorphilus gyrociliatus]
MGGVSVVTTRRSLHPFLFVVLMKADGSVVPIWNHSLEARIMKKSFPEVQEGGFYKPDCRSTLLPLALIVPITNDDKAILNDFLRHMHDFLQRQQQTYQIFFVELDESDGVKYKDYSGLLMNGGVEVVSNHVKILDFSANVDYYVKGKRETITAYPGLVTAIEINTLKQIEGFPLINWNPFYSNLFAERIEKHYEISFGYPDAEFFRLRLSSLKTDLKLKKREIFTLFFVCVNIQNVYCWGDSPHYSKKELERMERLEEIKRNLKVGGSSFAAKIPVKIHSRIDKGLYMKGGEFKMGINDRSAKNGEFPTRLISVKPFRIDKYPVTIKDFLQFKEKRERYLTTAEKEGYSYVFLYNVVQPAVVAEDFLLPQARWWVPVKGANWSKPWGPASNISEFLNYPAVHVTKRDAEAYCTSMGKRLPTEYEWEYAARGKLSGARYPWGETFRRRRMNVWQGAFPIENKNADGYKGLSPVDAFPEQNDFGLYDMVGNVWEWTSTKFSLKYRYSDIVEDINSRNKSDIEFVIRGGSFVDSSDGRFNYEARCATRKPLKPTFRGENIGFRCAESLIYQPVNTRGQQKPKKQIVSQAEKKILNGDIPPKRAPKVHTLEETWEFKAKKMVSNLLFDKEKKRDSPGRHYEL